MSLDEWTDGEFTYRPVVVGDHTPWQQCSNCRGYGVTMPGDYIADCYDCGGGGRVRARDSHGRFTRLPNTNPTALPVIMYNVTPS